MTEAVVNEFRQKVERLTLIPSSGGRFEVTINGDLVHSKHQTGEYPTNEAIIAEVARRMPSA